MKDLDTEGGIGIDGHFTLVKNGEVVVSKQNLITNTGRDWVTRRCFLDYNSYFTNGPLNDSWQEDHEEYPADIVRVDFGLGTTAPALTDTGIETNFGAVNERWAYTHTSDAHPNQFTYVYPEAGALSTRVTTGVYNETRVNMSSSSWCARRDNKVGAWASEVYTDASTKVKFRALDISATEQSFELGGIQTKNTQRGRYVDSNPASGPPNTLVFRPWIDEVYENSNGIGTNAAEPYGSYLEDYKNSGGRIYFPDENYWPNYGEDFSNFKFSDNQYVPIYETPPWGPDYYAEIYTDSKSEKVRIIGFENQYASFTLYPTPVNGWATSDDDVVRPRMIVVRGELGTTAQTFAASENPRIRLLPQNESSIVWKFNNSKIGARVDSDDPDDQFNSNGTPRSLDQYGYDHVYSTEAVMQCSDKKLFSGHRAFSRVLFDQPVGLGYDDKIDIYWKITIT